MPSNVHGQPVEKTVCLDVLVAVSAEMNQNLVKMKMVLKYWNFSHCF